MSQNAPPLNRKRLMDRRRYKHIGWYLSDDPDIELDIRNVQSIRNFLCHCMITPYMKYDEKLGAFLEAEFYNCISDKEIVIAVYTCTRDDVGYSENYEYYGIEPSPLFLKEVDDVVDTEWRALLERIRENTRKG